MDGRVPVTPTRWVQNTNISVTTDPRPQAAGSNVQKPRIAVKPKTPKTTDVADDVLSSFGMTKEDITPIRESARDSARESSAKTPVRVQQPQTQQPQQPNTQSEYSPNRVSKVAPSHQSTQQSQSQVQQPQSQTQRKVSPQVRTHAAPTATPQSHQSTQQSQHSTPQPHQTAHATKYTDSEITEMLSNGYLNITRELWDFLPVGSHVRFFKKGSGSKNERFRPGGFIKKQYITNEGKRILLMETIRDGTGLAGYITYPMAVDDLEEIWKRYPEECFIEIHLIHNSLVNKNKIINDLVARVTALESRIKK